MGGELHQAINGFPRWLDELADADRLGELVQSGFLFARKFPPGSPAEEVLPTLWGKVNKSKALASVWSRNDASGEPRPQSDATATSWSNRNDAQSSIQGSNLVTSKVSAADFRIWYK